MLNGLFKISRFEKAMHDKGLNVSTQTPQARNKMIITNNNIKSRQDE